MLKTFCSVTAFSILTLGCSNNTKVIPSDYMHRSVIYQLDNATFELSAKPFEIEAKCLVKNALDKSEMAAVYHSCDSLWQFELNQMKNLNVVNALSDKDRVFFTNFLLNVQTATGDEVNLENKVFKSSIADYSAKIP